MGLPELEKLAPVTEVKPQDLFSYGEFFDPDAPPPKKNASKVRDEPTNRRTDEHKRKIKSKRPGS